MLEKFKNVALTGEQMKNLRGGGVWCSVSGNYWGETYIYGGSCSGGSLSQCESWGNRDCANLGGISCSTTCIHDEQIE